MNERDDILLERYYNQELSAEESIEFEARLQEDTALAEAYELHVAMKSFLRENKQQTQFANFLEGVTTAYFEEQNQEEAVVIPIWKRRSFIASALAVAAVSIGTLLFPFLTSPNLYEQFNEHRPLALVEQSSEVSNDLVIAEKAFNIGDFQTAKTAITAYLNTNPNDIEAQLYQGICLLELNQNESAALIFEHIATQNSILQTEALWYWTLSYVQQGNIKIAKSKLKQLITENKDPYLRKRAEKLLFKLE